MLFPAASGNIESDANREATHHFTFGADVVIFAMIIWYVFGMASNSMGMTSWARKWGPLVMLITACTLLILDPIRHVLLDHGGVFFEEQDLAMYLHDGSGRMSFAGKFCQCASVSGLILMLCGVLWQMRLPEAVIGKFSKDAEEKTV